ncbi:hypothetical protein ACK346_20280 [Aeromonas veronii]
MKGLLPARCWIDDASKDLLLFIRPLHVARNLVRLEEGHRWKNGADGGGREDLLLFIQSFLGHNLAQ